MANEINPTGNNDKAARLEALLAEEAEQRADLKRRSAAEETVLEDEIARFAFRDVLREAQKGHEESFVYRAQTPEGEALRIVMPADAKALKRLDAVRVRLANQEAGLNVTLAMMMGMHSGPVFEEEQNRLERAEKNLDRVDSLIHATNDQNETLLTASRMSDIPVRLGTITQDGNVAQVIEVPPAFVERFRELQLLPPEMAYDDLPMGPPSLQKISMPPLSELTYVPAAHYYFDLDTPDVGMDQKKNTRDYQQDRISATPIAEMDSGRAEALLARTAGALVGDTKKYRNGSTFLGAITTGDGKIVTAHMGDSPAIYMIYDPETKKIERHDRLTIDHKPSMERVDIPGSSAWEEKGRVYLAKDNWLAMKRSLGDAKFGDFLIREPEIKTHDFSKELAEGKRVFVLMGSDGIMVEEKRYDEAQRVTPQAHAQRIEEFLRKNPEATLTELAQQVALRALSSTVNNDNITAAVLEIKQGQSQAVGIFDGHGKGNHAVDMAVDEWHRVMENVRANGLQAAFDHRDTIPPALGLAGEQGRESSWVQSTGAARSLDIEPQQAVKIEFERYIDALAEHITPSVAEDAASYLQERSRLEALGWRDPDGLDDAQHQRWRAEMTAIAKFDDYEVTGMGEIFKDFQMEVERKLPGAVASVRPGFSGALSDTIARDGSDSEMYIRKRVQDAILEKVAAEKGITINTGPGSARNH